MNFYIPDMCTDIYTFPEKSTLEKDILDELAITRQAMLDSMITQPFSEALVNIIISYLKSLNKNIINGRLETGKIFESEKVKWRSVLSSGIRMTLHSDSIEKPMIKGNFLYWEIFCCYLLIGYSLFNQAAKKNNVTEVQINQSVDLYCRAAGIFQFINTFYAFRCRSANIQAPEISIMPALVDLSLAEAQLLCIQKAQKRSVSVVNLIKLYAALVEKYRCCLETLKKNKDTWQELSSIFKDHVEGNYLNYKATCMFEYGKYQAENGSKHGTGAVCMAETQNILAKLNKNQQLAKRAGAGGSGNNNQMATAANLQESYTKLNNNITYQKLPSIESIEDEIFGGDNMVLIVHVKPFNIDEN